MTLPNTGKFSKSGEEPTELLRLLACEYVEALAQRGQIQLLESDGANGKPVVIAVFPNAKVVEGKIVDLEVK